MWSSSVALREDLVFRAAPDVRKELEAMEAEARKIERVLLRSLKLTYALMGVATIGVVIALGVLLAPAFFDMLLIWLCWS